MARRHLNTMLSLIMELILIIGTISLAYIAMRIAEDGLEHLVKGAYAKVHQ